MAIIRHRIEQLKKRLERVKKYDPVKRNLATGATSMRIRPGQRSRVIGRLRKSLRTLGRGMYAGAFASDAINRIREKLSRAHTAKSEARVSHRGPTARINRVKAALGRIRAKNPSAFPGHITEKTHRAGKKADRIIGRIMGHRPISGKLGPRARMEAALGRIAGAFAGLGGGPGKRNTPERVRAAWEARRITAQNSKDHRGGRRYVIKRELTRKNLGREGWERRRRKHHYSATSPSVRLTSAIERLEGVFASGPIYSRRHPEYLKARLGLSGDRAVISKIKRPSKARAKAIRKIGQLAARLRKHGVSPFRDGSSPAK